MPAKQLPRENTIVLLAESRKSTVKKNRVHHEHLHTPVSILLSWISLRQVRGKSIKPLQQRLSG